jgi:HEAT repeat protein
MADATTKKILHLLDDKQPAALRSAAVLVLGELGVNDGETSQSVCRALDDPDGSVRQTAIESVGKLKIAEALPTLLARIEKGGEEASAAAHAAARLGARGTRSLQDLMSKVAPGLRRYIAAALGSAGSASADAAAIEFLQDKDPGVVESAVRSLISQVPTLGSAKKHSLAEQLLQLLKAAKTGLPIASEAAAVRLLAALGDERAESLFWDRSVAPYPVDIRIAALQALGGLTERPGKEQVKRLFANAVERDFRLAAPALMMLQHQSVTPKTAADWLVLFRAPDVAARRLALEKLEDVDSAEFAETLVTQIGHPDRSFRDQVLARLTAMTHGQKVLQRALQGAETPDAAWTLARSMTPFSKQFDRPLLDKLFAQACTFHEASDRRADPFYFFLREADPAGLRDRLEARALAARKKKDYETALGYLRLLARDPSIGFAIRLELAACGVKVSNKELAHEARANDPSLGQFTHLAQGYEADLLKALDKSKWLEPEDLYYIGFHFAEKEGALKKFGGQVLQMLVKGSPKSKLAKDAKTKLKASGL